MKLFVTTLLLLVVSMGAFAQQNNDGPLVYVPQKYVSQEGLTHQQQLPGGASIIGLGREIGQAMKEGLASVVNEAERFGTTRVGTFVMAMIAWKVIGQDMVGIVFGVPLLFIGIAVWCWSMRRFFFGYRVVVKRTGLFSKEYEMRPQYKFEGEGRVLCGLAHFAGLAAWVIAMLIIIFK